MAGPVGSATGTAGLADVFAPCIGSLQTVNLGRGFGKDYDDCQIRLDALALRLSRFGVAVGVGEQANANSSPRPSIDATEKDVKNWRRGLDRLLQGLNDYKKRSEEFAEDITDGDGEHSDATALELCNPNTDLTGRFRSLHTATRDIVARRQQMGVSQSLPEAQWALYERMNYDHLTEYLTSCMDKIEGVNPTVKESLPEISQAELSSISDSADLKLLARIVGASDKVLVGAVEKLIAARGDTWENFDIAGEETSRVHVGHNYFSNEKGSSSVFSGFKIGGKGRAHIGHTFGTTGSGVNES